LNILSEIWRGRTVIASITKGYRFRTLTAGDISDTLLTVIEQVPSTSEYYCVPGQSTHRGRSQFYLPATLPRFLTVQATMKQSRNGTITHMPSGPAAFREFEMRYPAGTRDLILTHPGLMVAGGATGLPGGSGQQLLPGSESQLYTRFLINIDWPPGFGARALSLAAQSFPDW